MKLKIFFLICLAIAQQVAGQKSLDIFTFSLRVTAPTGYDSLLSGNARESGSFAALTLPVPISEKTIIYNSLNYFYFHVENESAQSDDIADPFNVHGFILRTGIIQGLNNGQSLQLLFAPRFMTDMEGGGADNLQFGGLAMYEKVFSKKLTMGFGAMFNQEFFGPYLVPLVNVDWSITQRFSISGLVPIYAKIQYLASSKLMVGISHFGLTTTFGLNNPAYAGDYLERQSIDLALFGRYNLIDNFYLEARVGESLNRFYRQYSPGDKVNFAIPLATFGDDRVPKNIPSKSGLFAEIRLIYNIPIPQEEE